MRTHSTTTTPHTKKKTLRQSERTQRANVFARHDATLGSTRVRDDCIMSNFYACVFVPSAERVRERCERNGCRNNTSRRRRRRRRRRCRRRMGPEKINALFSVCVCVHNRGDTAHYAGGASRSPPNKLQTRKKRKTGTSASLRTNRGRVFFVWQFNEHDHTHTCIQRRVQYIHVCERTFSPRMHPPASGTTQARSMCIHARWQCAPTRQQFA